MENEEQGAKKFYKTWWFWVIVIIIVWFQMFRETATPTQPVSQPAPVAETQQKQIPYQIIKRWTIPNGGEGKLIVISPANLNEADMTALGENLRNDTKNDRNAFISIFDDIKAVSLRDAVIADTASAKDQNFYDKHFIGEYDRNINTGYNEFDIYLDGIMGTQKAIKY